MMVRSAARNDLIPLEEERVVVSQLKTGDRAAFATLYGWYGDRVYRQAILPRLGNRELAEDCLRDTWRTVLEKIEQFTLVDRSIFFWIHRIAVNKAMDVHRRLKRDRKIEEAVKAQPVVQQTELPDRRREVLDTKRDVETSLSRMNERYAMALRMRLVEDRDREECAAALGVTLGNFDVILHRATKAFRKVYPP
ncbi:MAG: RNA polymerase sigma-70 factor (ECF subfamily) [Myxococcota bacterium]|jgi:RNA polymerase sigma-70 factor (ECF subfamily)